MMVEDVVETKELRAEKFGVGLTPIAAQTAIADATDAASVIARCNDVLAALRANGLILT